MQLSKEDLFHDGTETEAGSGGAVGAASNGDVLDFGRHGDDIMGGLWWFVHVDKAGSVKATWETSDSEDMSGAVTLVEKTATAAAGSYPFRNEPLPKGLKRYNRLKVATAAKSVVTAGLTTGRDEGVPFKG